MTNATLNRTTVLFGLSFSIMALLNGIVVIIKELNKETVFAWMASLTGHHWVTQNVGSILLFLLLAWGLSLVLSNQRIDHYGRKLVPLTCGATIIGSAMVVGFFLLHMMV